MTTLVAPDLVDEVTAAKCAHLTPVEKRIAWMRLGLKPEEIDGPPNGLLVGEQPPRAMGRCLPLFPYPPGSAAGRLAAVAEMPLGVYLGRFYRRNLFDEWRPWSAPAARESAVAIRAWARTLGNLRVLLLGAKVAEAFGVEGGPFKRQEEFHPDEEGGFVQHWVTIPHPSGLNRKYNNPDVVRGVQAAMMWCAGFV